MNAQHSSKSFEHGTPREVVDMARYVLGSIDYDPCSSRYWNEHVVKAKMAFGSQEDSHLDMDWNKTPWRAATTFFANPASTCVREAWKFCLARWYEGSSVFWVGFSLEQLAYLQADRALSSAFVRCIPRKRLQFLKPVKDGPPIPGTAPTHSNYLLLMANGPGAHRMIERFREFASSDFRSTVF